MSATALVPGLSHYLFLSVFLFCVGLYGVVTRRNAVAILMSIELMFNSVILALISFNHFVAPVATYNGQIFAIFIITVAAAEAAVGLALMIAIFRSRETINVGELNRLKW
ncbi:MAG: NADH-quinone oxidoreductase subunit NuoK [Chloroflexi bacterium]|nr:NADH-quinone oxidoreductase subunit NuoK [Chloroflexota bacterium]